MKLEFSRQTLEKYTNNKFHENPSSGSRIVPWIYWLAEEPLGSALHIANHSVSSIDKDNDVYRRKYGRVVGC